MLWSIAVVCKIFDDISISNGMYMSTVSRIYRPPAELSVQFSNPSSSQKTSMMRSMYETEFEPLYTILYSIQSFFKILFGGEP